MSDTEKWVIKVINNQTVDHPATYTNFLLVFPECPIQEEPTNEIISQYGYEVFVRTPAPIPSQYEHPPVEGPYIKVDNYWTNSWTITPFTEEEIIEKKWERVRLNRNWSLRQTDWTQLSNVTISNEEKELWNVYRQTLRDIPQTYINPDDVIFPRPPLSNDIFRNVFN